MRRVLVVILLGCFAATAAHAGDSFNVSGVEEWRFSAGYSTPSFIASGCTPSVPGSGLTLSAFACAGFVTLSTGQQEAIVQSSIAFTLPSSGDGAYWLLLYKDTSSSVSGWARSATTSTKASRYMVQKSATRPAEVNGGIIFARVDVLSGNIGNVAILGQRGASTTDVVSLASFGGAGDGIADSSYALQAAAATGRCIYVPEGTWYVPTKLTMTSGSLCLRGAGGSKTTLRARAATTPSSGSLVVSYTILQLSGMSSVDIRGMTFDGGITTPGAYTIAGNYVDQMAVIDIRTSNNVLLDDVWLTRALNTYTTTNQNPDIWLRFENTAFIYDSTNVSLLNGGIKNPSYAEGWGFYGVRGLVIDNFYSDAGEQSHTSYGLATPINVLGRGATLYNKDIKISNFYITQNRGSAMSLGCDQNIEVSQGYIVGLDGSNTVGKYRGINMSDTAAADYDVAHPSCDHIIIRDNVIVEAGDLAIQVGVGSGVTTTVKHTHAHIHNNVIFHTAGGIVVGGTTFANIENNQIRKALDYGTPGYKGSGIYLDRVTDVIVSNNIVDGSEVNGANKMQFGLVTFKVSRAKITGNLFRDAASYNIYTVVQTGDDNVYGDITLEHNQAINLNQIPASNAIRLGTSGALRLKSLWMANNSVNGLPWNDTNTDKFVVTWQNDPLILRAATVSSLSVPTGTTPTLIPYTSAGADTGGILNTGTGRVTAPRRGVYQIICAADFLAVPSDKVVKLWEFLNGAQSFLLDQRYSSATAGRNVQAHGAIQVQLQAGDIVDCRAEHGDAGSISLSALSTATYMMVNFVSDWP